MIDSTYIYHVGLLDSISQVEKFNESFSDIAKALIEMSKSPSSGGIGKFSPVLASLVTGFLIILSQYFIHYLSIKKERKNLIREVIVRCEYLTVLVKSLLEDLAYHRISAEYWWYFFNKEENEARKKEDREKQLKNLDESILTKKRITETIAEYQSKLQEFRILTYDYNKSEIESFIDNKVKEIDNLQFIKAEEYVKNNLSKSEVEKRYESDRETLKKKYREEISIFYEINHKLRQLTYEIK